MKTVPVYEAKNRFSELLAAVEQGDTVCITRRGNAVARLIAEPASERGEARRRIAASFERLRAWRDTLRIDGDIKSIGREGAD